MYEELIEMAKWARTNKREDVALELEKWRKTLIQFMRGAR